MQKSILLNIYFNSYTADVQFLNYLVDMTPQMIIYPAYACPLVLAIKRYPIWHKLIKNGYDFDAGKDNIFIIDETSFEIEKGTASTKGSGVILKYYIQPKPTCHRNPDIRIMLWLDVINGGTGFQPGNIIKVKNKNLITKVYNDPKAAEGNYDISDHADKLYQAGRIDSNDNYIDSEEYGLILELKRKYSKWVNNRFKN